MILHLDMDAFFAAVEVLDRPELEGRCILVGGDSDRGVVTTASYAARVYGVHSAMPMFMAKRLCPNAVILRPRMARYKEVSSQIMSILKEVSPVVEQVSIDEAYIDLAGLDRLSGSTEAIARGLKERIRKAIGLTCSIGGAPVKFLSKIASDRHKPDGLTLIPPEAVDSTIKALPVEKIPGVGKMALERLHRLGIRTMGDVRSYPEKSLTTCLGKFGYRLKELSHGIDRTTVSPDQPPKSVSSEETLSRDSTDRTLLRRLMLNQSEEVGHQLRKLRYFARTITVKIKHS
ncbi:MAG: DNA polymerase IV, partial [Desulfobacterales bacterium]